MSTYTVFYTGNIDNNVPFSNKYCCVPTEDLKKWVNAEFAAVEVFRKEAKEERSTRTTQIDLKDGDLIGLLGKTYMRLASESLTKIAENISEDVMEEYLLEKPVVIKISPRAE